MLTKLPAAAERQQRRDLGDDSDEDNNDDDDDDNHDVTDMASDPALQADPAYLGALTKDPVECCRVLVRACQVS